MTGNVHQGTIGCNPEAWSGWDAGCAPPLLDPFFARDVTPSCLQTPSPAPYNRTSELSSMIIQEQQHLSVHRCHTGVCNPDSLTSLAPHARYENPAARRARILTPSQEFSFGRTSR